MFFEVSFQPHQAWFQACENVAQNLVVDLRWEAKNFYGLLGDIKEKSTPELQHYFQKRPGLALKLGQLYLKQGIQKGAGYQSCAALALESFLQNRQLFHPKDSALDVGTGIGTIPGALGLTQVSAFDRIPEFLFICQQVDQQLGKNSNVYWCQDMFLPWTTRKQYRHIFLGLVLHQINDEEALRHILYEAYSHLEPQGNLWITLPSNTIGSKESFLQLIQALDATGFFTEKEQSGLICSLEETDSFFWMFLIQCRPDHFFSKKSPLPIFSQLKYREDRAKKRERIRRSNFSPTETLHTRFRFISWLEMQTDSVEWNYSFLQQRRFI